MQSCEIAIVYLLMKSKKKKKESFSIPENPSKSFIATLYIQLKWSSYFELY